jgi:hypothetical protein
MTGCCMVSGEGIYESLEWISAAIHAKRSVSMSSMPTTCAYHIVVFLSFCASSPNLSVFQLVIESAYRSCLILGRAGTLRQ